MTPYYVSYEYADMVILYDIVYAASADAVETVYKSEFDWTRVRPADGAEIGSAIYNGDLILQLVNGELEEVDALPA